MPSLRRGGGREEASRGVLCLRKWIYDAIQHTHTHGAHLKLLTRCVGGGSSKTWPQLEIRRNELLAPNTDSLFMHYSTEGTRKSEQVREGVRRSNNFVAMHAKLLRVGHRTIESLGALILLEILRIGMLGNAYIIFIL